MSANEQQHGGSHYKNKAIQPWDYILSNNLGFCEGNAIKYITRWKEKGGVQDLQKAIHFLQKLVEVEEKKQASITATAKWEMQEALRQVELEAQRQALFNKSGPF